MIFMWVAVVLVIGLLIGFVSLSVFWLSKAVGDAIRDRSVELISRYDSLLEDRSRELSALDVELRYREQEEEKAAKKPFMAPAEKAQTQEGGLSAPAFLRAAENISMATYRDEAAGGRYQKIREAFRFSPEDALRQMPERRQGANPGTFPSILSALSFDTVYQLSTLPGETQYALLEECLPDSFQEQLHDYASQSKRFDAIAFYDRMLSEEWEGDQRVFLRVAPHDRGVCPAGVELVRDPGICEGFQIQADRLLYDYCIRTREIG